MLHIRRFSSADLGEIMRITYSSLGENYSPDLYINIHNAWREGILVAEDMGNILGFIACVLPESMSARILMLAVRKEFRCRGIGTMLLNAFTNECALKGIRTISLEVRKSNTIAIRFYMRHGYQIIRELRNYYTDGENGYQMWKQL